MEEEEEEEEEEQEEQEQDDKTSQKIDGDAIGASRQGFNYVRKGKGAGTALSQQ